MRTSDDQAARGFAPSSSARGRKYLKGVVGSGIALLAVAAAMAACSSAGNNAAACTDPGCECATEGATAECGETTDRGIDSFSCRHGTTTCSGGHWGACIGEKRSVRSLHTKGPAGPCIGNPCDPGCLRFDDGSTTDLDGGGITPAPDGGITLAEGGETGWSGGSCTGLQCAIDPCGGDYTKTQLTGKVYDPAGLNPIYNVVVYVPNAALTPLTDGVSCDSCATPSGSPIVSALTDYTGTFTLKGVPAGASIPLVIQSGKWRRQVTIPSVTKCVSNSTAALLGSDSKPLVRFPKNRSEGNIPRIAFVSGGADPFECVLMKMGIDTTTTSSEVGPPDVGGVPNPDRIHYYNSPTGPGQNLDGTRGGPGGNAGTRLWDTAAHLNYYDAVILACEGFESNKGATVNQRLVDFANLGGRIFTTHYSYSYLQFAPGASQWPNVVKFWNHTFVPVDPMTTIINRTFPKGDNFALWLNAVGASPTLGRLAIQEGRHDYDYVDRTRATPWMYSNSDGSIPTGSALKPAGASCIAGAECISGTCTGASTSTAITNGGFESGLTGWTKVGAVGGVAAPGHSGASSVKLGSQCAGANNSVAQTFTAPAGGGTLSFWYNNSCTDPGFDWAQATLFNNTTGISTTVLSPTCSGGGWTQVTAALVGGNSYTLTLLNHEYPDCLFPTSTLFDDVTVSVPGTCAAGGSTASCTLDSDCPSGGVSGAGCWNGTCIPPHQQEALMTFNVPIGVAPASQCGRIVYSDFHVSASALNFTTFTFPGGCNPGALSAQEKALEFMLFDLTSCLVPDYVPPTPPSFAPATVARDYTATCPAGYRPTWHFFDWQTVTPSDSKISFTAQTGDTWPAVTAMTQVPLATVSGPPVTTWTGVDVASIFAAQAPPVPSNKLLLRVNITLTPSSDGKLAPTLVDWRQSYTCVPTE